VPGGYARGVWEGFVRFSEHRGEYAATRNGWFVYESELRIAQR
jgi:hypothetical protein